MATLVTGLGYIGSALAHHLVHQGVRVVAIENLFSTPRTSLDDLLASGVSLVEGSIADQSALDRALSIEPIDTVFHLAAQSSARPEAASLAYTQETNFTGQRMLLDACAERRVRHVVIASSTRLYRTPLPRVVTERSPIEPSDLVHLSHLYGEVLLAEHRRRSAASAGTEPFISVAARIGIVHGLSPVMKTDERFLAVPQLFCLRAARGEPLMVATGHETELAFVHLSDAVAGLLCCAESTEGEVVNLAAEVRSVASLAETVQKAGRERGLDVRIEYQGSIAEIGERYVDSRLTARGFKPSLRIEDSIGEVLDHYLAARGAA